jgi:hypothetical protein
MEKCGKQSRAEGRGLGRERAEALDYANQNGQVLSAAKAARRGCSALGEACLRTVPLVWFDDEVLLTALVTER